MLSRRVAVGFRVPAPAHVPRTTLFRRDDNFPQLAICHGVRRSYATPSRPKKAVGEPSRPVKRAVKRAASSAPSAESPAKQTVASKKTVAAGEGAAPKEKKPKKAAVKKAKPAAAKKKKVAKPKKVVKKVLTDEQKAAKKAANEATKDKLELAELKRTALTPPKVPSSSAWKMFFIEKTKAKGAFANLKGTSRNDVQNALAENSKRTAAEWKSLSPADVEHYNHIAHTDKESLQAAYDSWVASHTAEEIKLANRARKTLRRKTTGQWPPIKDERAVKQPLTPYMQFYTNRQGSADFANIKAVDRAKLVSQEWKALNMEEKDKYNQLGTEEKKRYADEHSKIYGSPPPFVEQPQAASASASL